MKCDNKENLNKKLIYAFLILLTLTVCPIVLNVINGIINTIFELGNLFGTSIINLIHGC